jgi:predicted Fe-S protein YdhL (DUF1289 family)
MTQASDQTKLASPCINICALDKAGFCLGCFRTVDEITRWSKVSNEERRAILAQVAIRRGESEQ